jgi:hypothetical protein
MKRAITDSFPSPALCARHVFSSAVRLQVLRTKEIPLTPAFAYTVIATVWLCTVSLGVAGNAISCFIHGYPFTALKCVGISIVFLSGCCDPVNWLWNLTPFL